LPIERALEVTGGEPIARLGPRPIAAMTRHGEGRVIAVGFGPALNDESLGREWTREPDDALRERFEVLFELARLMLSGEPIKRPASP
jgi:hypothetical protein